MRRKIDRLIPRGCRSPNLLLQQIHKMTDTITNFDCTHIEHDESHYVSNEQIIRAGYSDKITCDRLADAFLVALDNYDYSCSPFDGCVSRKTYQEQLYTAEWLKSNLDDCYITIETGVKMTDALWEDVATRLSNWTWDRFFNDEADWKDAKNKNGRFSHLRE